MRHPFVSSFAAAILLSCSVSAAGQSASEPFRVGSLVAAPGQLVSAMIDIPEGVDPATQVPVTIVEGEPVGVPAFADRNRLWATAGQAQRFSRLPGGTRVSVEAPTVSVEKPVGNLLRGAPVPALVKEP